MASTTTPLLPTHRTPGNKMPGNKIPGSLPLSDVERQYLDDPGYTDRHLQLDQLLQALEQSPETRDSGQQLDRAACRLKIAGLQLDLDDRDNAWQHAHSTIEVFIEQHRIEDAALAAQYIYLCDKDDAVSAIGQAAWLAVTFPVDPHLTVNILDHIVDETPDKSDGAAVAAATAHYVVDLRAEDNNREQLELASGSMLARVARRHSGIEDQQQFDVWVQTLELDDPEKFLIRLRNVIDVMVQDTWWFDREALSNTLPTYDDDDERPSDGHDEGTPA